MAQLRDHCFAFAGPLLPVAEAERIIAEKVSPVGEIQQVELHAVCWLRPNGPKIR